ncbi:MAG: hypothetical protein OK455_03680 [Thaumarchaeota archaeon]|nr:hypothetical protein [Nitrososphaerota archaeon]
MINAIDDEDKVFHAPFIGSNGAGKTNAQLDWLAAQAIGNRKDLALILSTL